MSRHICRGLAAILIVTLLMILNAVPLLDIKPYIPEFDIRKVERIGWLEKNLYKLSTSKDNGRFTE